MIVHGDASVRKQKAHGGKSGSGEAEVTEVGERGTIDRLERWLAEQWAWLTGRAAVALPPPPGEPARRPPGKPVKLRRVWPKRMTSCVLSPTPRLKRELRDWFGADADDVVLYWVESERIYAVCHRCRGLEHKPEAPVVLYINRGFTAEISELLGLGAAIEGKPSRWVAFGVRAYCSVCLGRSVNFGEDRLERDFGRQP